MYRKMGGPQNRHGRCGEEGNFGVKVIEHESPNPWSVDLRTDKQASEMLRKSSRLANER
jgi:hypothetical protein